MRAFANHLWEFVGRESSGNTEKAKQRVSLEEIGKGDGVMEQPV